VLRLTRVTDGAVAEAPHPAPGAASTGPELVCFSPGGRAEIVCFPKAVSVATARRVAWEQLRLEGPEDEWTLWSTQAAAVADREGANDPSIWAQVFPPPSDSDAEDAAGSAEADQEPLQDLIDEEGDAGLALRLTRHGAAEPAAAAAAPAPDTPPGDANGPDSHHATKPPAPAPAPPDVDAAADSSGAAAPIAPAPSAAAQPADRADQADQACGPEDAPAAYRADGSTTPPPPAASVAAAPATATPATPGPPALVLPPVGARVRAFFEERGCWFHGTVLDVHNRAQKNVFVEYDDGDTGWADFPEPGFEVVASSTGADIANGAAFSTPPGSPSPAAPQPSPVSDSWVTLARIATPPPGGGSETEL